MHPSFLPSTPRQARAAVWVLPPIYTLGVVRGVRRAASLACPAARRLGGKPPGEAAGAIDCGVDHPRVGAVGARAGATASPSSHQLLGQAAISGRGVQPPPVRVVDCPWPIQALDDDIAGATINKDRTTRGNVAPAGVLHPHITRSSSVTVSGQDFSAALLLRLHPNTQQVDRNLSKASYIVGNRAALANPFGAGAEERVTRNGRRAVGSAVGATARHVGYHVAVRLRRAFAGDRRHATAEYDEAKAADCGRVRCIPMPPTRGQGAAPPRLLPIVPP